MAFKSSKINAIKEIETKMNQDRNNL